jgi:hypothetical protein
VKKSHGDGKGQVNLYRRAKVCNIHFTLGQVFRSQSDQRDLMPPRHSHRQTRSVMRDQ